VERQDLNPLGERVDLPILLQNSADCGELSSANQCRGSGGGLQSLDV